MVSYNKIRTLEELQEAATGLSPDAIARARYLRWERTAHHFMVASGTRELLVHVDWAPAANRDVIDVVVDELIRLD